MLKKTIEPKEDFVYEPSVELAYETLTQYLDGHQINVNYFQVNDAQEAFALFLQRKEINKGNSVFLVGKENLEKVSRSKRDTTSISANPSNTSVILTGPTCAALMESIYIVDNTALPSKTENLHINESTSTFDCNNANAT